MPTLSEITELYQQVVDAQPDVIADAAARWRRAGARAADTADVAQHADTTTAESFRNGAAVYDAPAATRATRAALGDGGEHLDRRHMARLRRAAVHPGRSGR